MVKINKQFMNVEFSTYWDNKINLFMNFRYVSNHEHLSNFPDKIIVHIISKFSLQIYRNFRAILVGWDGREYRQWDGV